MAPSGPVIAAAPREHLLWPRPRAPGAMYSTCPAARTRRPL